VHVSYHPDYEIPLPEGHAFPMRKYPLLHARLLAEGLLDPSEVHAPAEADWDAIGLVHAAEYVAKLRSGTLSESEQRRIGMPWSPALVRRARLAVQGTIDAAVAALEGPVPIAANLAGGTHHALADSGEGYCTLNDVAIAVRWLAREGYARRFLVCDFDVHHGNGTAALVAQRPDAVTVSFHSERLFPHDTGDPCSDAVRGIYNRPLGPEATGTELLAAVARFLAREGEALAPDLLIVAAGFDGHEEDVMSGWQVSTEDYAALVAMLRAFADEQCGGRMLVTLEGGYDPVALEACVLAMIRVLA